MPDFRILVKIDPTSAKQGSREINRELGRVENAADRLRRTIARALAFVGIGLGIRELIELGDAFTNLQNRLRTVVTDQAQLALVTEELLKISNRTRSSFQSTAELYARMGLAARDLGVSQTQLLQFTESVNQAILLSGASAAEAGAGLIQLSQGLASGALRGDELRSVLEQLPAVADVIGKELGVTRGELRRMGEEGKITSDIILRAFGNARVELAERFSRSVPTVGQALTVLRNNVIALIGGFNQATGAGDALARILLKIADNADTLGRAFGALGLVLGVTFGTQAVSKAVGGLKALGAAIAAHPLIALGVAILAAVAALAAFSDKIGLGADGLLTLRDVGLAVFLQILDGLRSMGGVFEGVFGAIADGAEWLFGEVDISLGDILQAALVVLDKILGASIGLVKAMVAAFQGVPPALEDLFIRGLNAVIGLVEGTVNRILQAVSAVTQLAGLGEVAGVELGRIENQAEGAAGKLGTSVRDAFLEGWNTALVTTSVESALSRAETIARERREREQAAAKAELGGAGAPRPAPVSPEFKSYLQDLDRQIVLLRLGNRERQIQEGLFKAEDAVKRQLTATEGGLVSARLKEIQALQDREAIDQHNRDVETEIRLLQTSAQERAMQEPLIRLEAQLTRALTAEEKALINARLVELEILKDRETVNAFLTNLRNQADLLRLTNREREIQNQILALETDLKRSLTAAERSLVESQIAEVQALQAQADILDELRGPQEDLIRRLEALRALFEAGRISADEYNQSVVKACYDALSGARDMESGLRRGLLAISEEFGDTARVAEDALVNAFRSAEDALVEFVSKGKADFRSLVDSIVADLTRLAVRQAITGPLAQAMGLWASGGMTAAGALTAGFQHGGSFTVGGTGGVDSRLVAFRATPGERVTVTPPGAGGGGEGGRPVQINFNISTPNPEAFKRSQGQIMARTQAALSRAGRRNN